jgi:hypothetical protein
MWFRVASSKDQTDRGKKERKKKQRKTHEQRLSKISSLDDTQTREKTWNIDFDIPVRLKDHPLREPCATVGSVHRLILAQP